MVWKGKKSRKPGSKNAVYPNDYTPGVRSCLRVGLDEKLFVKQRGHQNVDSNDRDHSVKSSRSIRSLISGSGSSKSRDTVGSDDHLKSSESGCSGGSLISGGRSSIRDPQHSPIISGVSEEGKSVRFGFVAIREHERVVGDNPSCSTGPPIGIGWRHTCTQKILIDEYEEKRQYRRKQIVLTRSEREELLLNWGIAFDDIIDAIRTNIRVKNQRRQTVTNLGKADRFEEALEGATRRIKRAFLLRRSTAEMVKKLQEQADVAAKIHSPSSSVSDEHHAREEQAAGISSKEEVRKKAIFKEISVPDFQKTVPSEMQLVRASSFISDFDDIHTSVSGFSLGNSTTASAKEIEQFYRELEFEMFGDVPLPDMVGETLVVPGAIPEDQWACHNPPSSETFTEPPSMTPAYPEKLTDTNLHGIDISHMGDDMLKTIPPLTSDCNLLFHDDPLTAIRMGNVLPPNIRIINDLDPLVDFGSIEQHGADRARAYLSETVTAMEQRYLHPSLTPPLPFTSGTHSLNDMTPDSAGRYSRSSRSQDSGGARSRRLERRKDSPIVCHIPPYSKRSLTHWMEGHDDCAIFAMSQPQHEVVTITEDPRWDDRIRPSPSSPPIFGPSLPSPSGFGPPPPSFIAPPQFPASFY